MTITLHEIYSHEEIEKLVGARVTKVESGDAWIGIDLQTADGTTHALMFSDDGWHCGNDAWEPTAEEILTVLNSIKESIDASEDLGETKQADEDRAALHELIHGNDKVGVMRSHLSFLLECTPEEVIGDALMEIARKLLPGDSATVAVPSPDKRDISVIARETGKMIADRMLEAAIKPLR